MSERKKAKSVVIDFVFLCKSSNFLFVPARVETYTDTLPAMSRSGCPRTIVVHITIAFLSKIYMSARKNGDIIILLLTLPMWLVVFFVGSFHAGEEGEGYPQ